MRIKNKTWLFSIISGSVLFVFSCKNSTQNNTGLSDSLEVSYEKEKLNYFKYRFPGPDELFYHIRGENIKYDNSLLNPANNKDSYIAGSIQALNLGIYLSDLGYISITKNWEDAHVYMNSIFDLSDKLGLSTAFDKKTLHRVEANIDNVDSIISITDDLNDLLFDHLVETDNERLYGIVAFGSLIEYFYISMNIFDLHSEDSRIKQNASDYKYFVDNLRDFLLYYEEDDQVMQKMINELDLFNAFFHEQKANEKGRTTVEKLDDGTLVFKGGKKVTINGAGIDSLISITTHLRKRIISNTF